MRTYVKIGGTELDVLNIEGRVTDREWDGRESKIITLEHDFETVRELFAENAAWSICREQEIISVKTSEDGSVVYTEGGEPVTETTVETETYDNSGYCVAGDVIDHRDGTVSVKMGKPTSLEEAYELLYGEE